MKKNVTEVKKTDKLLNNPLLKKKLYAPKLKKTNLEAQNKLKQIPDMRRDDILDLLDWMEEYLLILKK